jgi:hypothetical protein
MFPAQHGEVIFVANHTGLWKHRLGTLQDIWQMLLKHQASMTTRTVLSHGKFCDAATFDCEEVCGLCDSLAILFGIVGGRGDEPSVLEDVVGCAFSRCDRGRVGQSARPVR